MRRRRMFRLWGAARGRPLENAVPVHQRNAEPVEPDRWHVAKTIKPSQSGAVKLARRAVARSATIRSSRSSGTRSKQSLHQCRSITWNLMLELPRLLIRSIFPMSASLLAGCAIGNADFNRDLASEVTAQVRALLDGSQSRMPAESAVSGSYLSAHAGDFGIEKKYYFRKVMIKGADGMLEINSTLAFDVGSFDSRNSNVEKELSICGLIQIWSFREFRPLRASTIAVAAGAGAVSLIPTSQPTVIHRDLVRRVETSGGDICHPKPSEKFSLTLTGTYQRKVVGAAFSRNDIVDFVDTISCDTSAEMAPASGGLPTHYTVECVHTGSRDQPNRERFAYVPAARHYFLIGDKRQYTETRGYTYNSFGIN